MCLVVDTNVAPDVFAAPATGPFRAVYDALKRGRAVAVIGGTRMRFEYERLRSIQPIILELDRAGRCRQLDDGAVDGEAMHLTREGLCRSDDEHILAVARVSGVRLLCSNDTDLHADFTNPRILSPKGSVYQNASHRRLIAKHCSRRRRPPATSR